MQIIQSIREKGAAIIIIVIAISLIGFILMDAKQGSGSGFFGGPNDNIGKVNGEKISLAYFNKRVAQAEYMEAARSGQQPTGSRINQIREQVWNQIVAEKIFYKEAGKVGIDLSANELKAILLSSDQSNPLMQDRGMADPATGKIDPAKAQEAYDVIRKSKGGRRDSLEVQYIDPIKLNSAAAKYNGLIGAATYYPSWMKAKDMAEAKSFATISYVAVPYNEVSDSAVKVTDADINAYVAKHKALFKQEAGRTISYVTFSQLPSAADSAEARKMVEDLKTPFAADTNAVLFTNRNTSAIEYNDNFLPKSKIQSSALDTIVKQPIGTVYGPYVDGKYYSLAKVIGTMQMPDSVNARHILIGTVDPQTGKQLMEDDAAKKLADSVLVMVKSGADFGALAAKYSTDQGSKDSGGVYKNISYGQMVPEFNQYIFTKPVGTTEVVKTQFGYHVLEVLSQKNMKPAYKIAFEAKEIVSSPVTVNDASLAATKASSQKDAKALEAYLKTTGKSLIESPAIIKESDFAIGNMEDARAVVKWAFDAKKNEVSEPFNVGNDFVVATVNNIYEEGTQDATMARKGSEAIIRNEKKADIIIAKLGANPTLEKAAQTYNKTIMTAGADSSITMAAQIINGLGVEYKVIGAAFNKANQAKPSAPIPGTSAVYVIQTQSIGQKLDPTADAQAQAQAGALSKIRQQSGNWFESLRKNADVQDKRSRIF
jgi:peptidyl-prolyl cis-trans isomerase D